MMKEVKKKNWAVALKDKVVTHFEKKKKESEDLKVYAKKMVGESKARSEAKKVADSEPIMKGKNRGTKKVVSDLKKYGGLSDSDIAKFVDKPKPKVKGKK
jgi:hypothetical protein